VCSVIWSTEREAMSCRPSALAYITCLWQISQTHQKCALENCSIYRASSLNGTMWRSPCDGNIMPTMTKKQQCEMELRFPTLYDSKICDWLSDKLFHYNTSFICILSDTLLLPLLLLLLLLLLQLFYGSLDFAWDNPSEPVPDHKITKICATHCQTFSSE